MSTRATNLGFPRIGAHRELKKALEAYWAGRITADDLHRVGRDLRRTHWTLQRDLGLDHIPSNDFSLYDHVLDTVAMVGAVPRRFAWAGDTVDLDLYFAMARGLQEKEAAEQAGVPAMEMTKWFDTNYHYIVPEFEPDQPFRLASTQVVDAFNEAKALGIVTRPVLLGPVTFLLLGKTQADALHPLDLLDEVLPVYEDVLRRLQAAGAEWVQLDEPFLALDLDDRTRRALRHAYDRLAAAADLDLLVATYFEGLHDNLPTALSLPVSALHLDLVRAPQPWADVLDQVPASLSLSLGLVDGRNVWRTDLDAAKVVLDEAVAQLGRDRVLVGPSCSLLHVPVDLETEPGLEAEARLWLAFARQKLEEIVALARSAGNPTRPVDAAFEASRRATRSRSASAEIHNDEVKRRVAAIDEGMLRRRSPHARRRPVQQEALQLPLLPTTTIGSFPQTDEVRQARHDVLRGNLSRAHYDAFLEREIARTIRRQEAIGLDVLVHGEAERSDMVEYFGQQLGGFLFTQNGWVQSYGSRCVRPPILYGDVARPAPMTVRWTTYAQSLTERPVKGMLTGPVTMLQWSFVRDDQPLAQTCRQLALAMRDEVRDLEAAGIRVIQIDEPALREGLPLRRRDWDDFLHWAVDCFRLAAAGVADATQIHTHMCYAEFSDIMGAIAELDADVLSIEASRSKMELLDRFETFAYPNQIGPGVYDIHSPRVPSRDEMEALLRKALAVLAADQLWVNPDCGLKTRRWAEVEPALRNMVAAARNLRSVVPA